MASMLVASARWRWQEGGDCRRLLLRTAAGTVCRVALDVALGGVWLLVLACGLRLLSLLAAGGSWHLRGGGSSRRHRRRAAASGGGGVTVSAGVGDARLLDLAWRWGLASVWAAGGHGVASDWRCVAWLPHPSACHPLAACISPSARLMLSAFLFCCAFLWFPPPPPASIPVEPPTDEKRRAPRRTGRCGTQRSWS